MVEARGPESNKTALQQDLESQMRMGEFLVSKGMVTKFDIVIALEKQRSKQQPLGRVAIRHGYLTINQVFDLLRLQTDRLNYQLPDSECHFLFGNLAVEFGYIDDDQRIEILRLQALTRPDLMDVLVNMEVLTEEESCEVVQEFAALSTNMSR